MKSVLAAIVGILTATAAFAQSSPGFNTGDTPTASQWNSYFAAKQNVLPSYTTGLPLVGGVTGGITQGTRSGNTTAYGTTSGTLTSGHCVKIDASGNLVDSGGSCGIGSISTGTAGQFAYYPTGGTSISGLTPPFTTVNCNNNSGDATLLQNVLNAVGAAGGGTVYIAPGTCLLNSGISITYPNMTLRGSGKGSTTLSVNFANGDVITVGSSSETTSLGFPQVQDFLMSPAAGITRASGAGIHKYATGRAIFTNLDIESMYIGIFIDGTYTHSGSASADYNTFVSYSFIESNNYGIQIGSVGSTYANNFVQNVFLDHMDISGNADGLQVYSVGGLYTSFLNGLNNTIGENVVPATNQFVEQYSNNDQWDSSKVANVCLCATGGVISGSNFVNLNVTYGNATGASGLVINPSAGYVTGINFVGLFAYVNDQYGVYIAPNSATVGWINFSSPVVINNNLGAHTGAAGSGISIASGVSHITMSGGRSGSGGTSSNLAILPNTSSQIYGIYLGTDSYIQITGMDTTGNTTGGSGCSAAYGSVGASVYCSGTLTSSVIGGNM